MATDNLNIMLKMAFLKP